MGGSIYGEVSNDLQEGLRVWRVGAREWPLGRFPLIMGVVNVTPDSFSDGSLHFDADTAVEHALALAADGADLIDIGGESTRPGSAAVPLDEELRRVVPVVERVTQHTRVPVSIDTTKAEVARQALAAGAAIVNDISGLTFDPEMPHVCANAEAGVICMHIRGTPKTMQEAPHYDDVVREVCEFLQGRMEELEARGISRERIVIDPGIGFGKTAEHNLQILANIQTFHELGRPVLIGHSRKRFLEKLLGRPVDERLHGTLGVAVALASQNADIIRVHDVRATRDTLLAWRAVVDRIALGIQGG